MRRKKTAGKRETLTRIVKFRVTEDEYMALQRKREDDRYHSLSALMHAKMFSRASISREGALSRAEIDTVDGYVTEMRRIGVNINQAVRKLNTLDPTAEKVIGYETSKLKEMMGECLLISARVEAILDKNCEILEDETTEQKEE